MPDRKPFDETEPFDAIAQLAKSAVAEAFESVHSQAAFVTSDKQLRCEALLTGLIVGACGCALAMISEDAHAELRAGILAMIPGCFDQAREIIGLEPIGKPS